MLWKEVKSVKKGEEVVKVVNGRFLFESGDRRKGRLIILKSCWMLRTAERLQQ